MTMQTNPRGIGPLETWDAEILRDRLLAAAEKLPEELADRIAAQGERLVPGLIEILNDEWLADEDAPGGGYAPLHAADLLSRMKAPAAIPLLLDILAAFDYNTLLFNRAVFALKDYGPAAFEAVMQALLDNDDPEIEPVLVEVLSGLGHKDPRLHDHLVGFLRVNPEQGAAALAEYGDRVDLPLLQKTFDELPDDDPDFPHLGNLALNELAWAIEELDGHLTPTQQQRRDQAVQRSREADPGPPVLPRKVDKPGRNDACWCGSGKKYKKCHLGDDHP